jgi:hypothetical protein
MTTTSNNKSKKGEIKELEKRIAELERKQTINITIQNPQPAIQIPERCPYCLLPTSQCRGHYIS